MSLIMVGMLMIILLVGAFSVLMNDTKSDKDYAKVKDLGFEISRELVLASEVHEGYKREIFIPENVGTKDYNLENTERFIILTVDNINFPFPIPVINGTLKKGHNTIKNIGGIVFVE